MTRRGLLFSLVVLACTLNSRGGPEPAAADPQTAGVPADKPGKISILSAAEGKTLYAIVRDTLVQYGKSGEKDFSFDEYSITDGLRTPMPVVIIVNVGGQQLRGGVFDKRQPLFQAVHTVVVRELGKNGGGAFVEGQKADDVDINIFLVESVQPTRSLGEFRPGAHGILMENPPTRVFLLPFEAAACGGTKDDVMEALCLKNGLPSDAWRRGHRYRLFTTARLSE